MQKCQMCNGIIIMKKKNKGWVLTFVPDPEITHSRLAVYFVALQTIEYWQDAVCCLQTFTQDKVFCPRRVVHLHLHVHDAMFHSIYMQGGRGQLLNASNIASSRRRSSLIGLRVRCIHGKTLVIFLHLNHVKLIFFSSHNSISSNLLDAALLKEIQFWLF